MPMENSVDFQERLTCYYRHFGMHSNYCHKYFYALLWLLKSVSTMVGECFFDDINSLFVDIVIFCILTT